MAVEPVFTAVAPAPPPPFQAQTEAADNSRGWPVALWQASPYEIQLLAAMSLVAGVILLALRADKIVAAWRGEQRQPEQDGRPSEDLSALVARLDEVAADLERSRVTRAAQGGMDAAALHLVVQRLDRLSDSVGAVHGRVDDLYQRAAAADRLSALESRVDDLSVRMTCPSCD